MTVVPPADVSVPVVVVNLSDHTSVGIARSLGAWGVEVHGVHDERTAASRSRFIRSMTLCDLEDESTLVRTLLDLSVRLGSRPLLIPTGDSTSMVIDERAQDLREAYRFPRQPPGLARMLYEKKGMHDLCIEHGLSTPATSFPQSRADVDAFLETATFPVVVKAIDVWRLVQRAGVRLVIVHSAAELLAEYDRLEDGAHPNLMLQEYIPGGAESVWMFDGYFDEASNCLFGVTGQKLRQCPPDTGSTSLGICIANPTVHQETTAFMKRLGYRGILDLGFRFDHRDGRYKLLDVNPRIGSTFRLFVGRDGMDVVRALYLDQIGQPVPASPFPERRRWAVETNDVVSFLTLRSERRLGVGNWIRSFRGVEETAWFSRRDPAPVVAIAAQSARRVVRRIARSFRAYRQVRSKR